VESDKMIMDDELSMMLEEAVAAYNCTFAWRG
jgi:hypothetical protein